jgi:hypothetical protein
MAFVVVTSTRCWEQVVGCITQCRHPPCQSPGVRVGGSLGGDVCRQSRSSIWRTVKGGVGRKTALVLSLFGLQHFPGNPTAGIRSLKMSGGHRPCWLALIQYAQVEGLAMHGPAGIRTALFWVNALESRARKSHRYHRCARGYPCVLEGARSSVLPRAG